VRDPGDRRRVGLEMSDTAMAAGADHVGGLARDVVGAMRATATRSSPSSAAGWRT
jgi:hypothetical protein